MISNVRLPRLPINWKEQPQLLERYWDEAMTRIEETFNAILQIPELQTAITAAQAAADAANAAAGNAQSVADGAVIANDATTKEQSILTSYVSNFTDPLITATSVGVITIDNHDRVYGDSTLNPTVAVTGGVINPAVSPGDVVRIYYDQPSRTGGAVTYQWTIDPADPPVQGGDRHSVGAVEIPAAGTNDGKPLRNPGFVYT